ncbi:DNA-directed RNA polymerase subunit omega [Alphaproteobacteria bacterium]|nr:DNA-directed RNA polymerase subunit omega [Alphaproteobacteria bacterium]
MARVTVQDCIRKVPNRFDLVVAAAQRSREISNGMPIEIERDNDKNPVVSLREIAEDAIDPSTLQERFIRSMQKNILRAETVDDEVASIDDEFSAYLNNAEDINPKNNDLLSNNIKTDEENSFDDISIDLLKSED